MADDTPHLPPFPTTEQWLPAIRLAVEEDTGGRGAGGDVTARLTIPETALAVGTVVQKAPGVACGLPAVEAVCKLFDERLKVEFIPGLHLELVEGRHSDAGPAASVPLLRVRGPARSLLAAERTILNVLGHLSGIATLTRLFARRCAGTRAEVYDTRKTLPGLRALEKYAVLCGGGRNHRMGLHDMVLVKDNHLALAGHDPAADLAGRVAELVRQSRAEDSSRPIEVEVDTEAQFRQVLGVAGVDVILLDNMDCPTMTRCVKARDAAGGSVALEASGGVTLETARDIAACGVERIAVGALTHSAANLDVGMDLEPA